MEAARPKGGYSKMTLSGELRLRAGGDEMDLKRRFASYDTISPVDMQLRMGLRSRFR